MEATVAENYYNEALTNLGVFLPKILVPSDRIEKHKWAVIACDQYTSEPEYWEKVEEYVGEAPSTLRCMLPECYLQGRDAEKRIAAVRGAMKEYLAEGVFDELPEGLVLVDRQTAFQNSRRGMVLAVDLEKYDYTPGAESLIRPTEGTIVERLPPRIHIRENAALEFPHVLVLLDDPEMTVIEPLFERKKTEEPLYSVKLMFGAGSVTGRHVSAEEAAPHLVKSLGALADHSLDREKPFLFAVGDGNHSLATAKVVWEKIKAELPIEDGAGHPARYALVEIVNLYDRGIHFEPIHRLLSGIDVGAFLSHLSATGKLSMTPCSSSSELEARVRAERKPDERHFTFGLVTQFETLLVRTGPADTSTPAAEVQKICEGFLAASAGRTGGGNIDYIHGTEALFTLSRQAGSAGCFLPGMDKGEIFSLVERDGVLPRKAFSIGEASEKRFYYEGRRIGISKKG
jgi:hypothetical protein